MVRILIWFAEPDFVSELFVSLFPDFETYVSHVEDDEVKFEIGSKSIHDVDGKFFMCLLFDGIAILVINKLGFPHVFFFLFAELPPYAWFVDYFSFVIRLILLLFFLLFFQFVFFYFLRAWKFILENFTFYGSEVEVGVFITELYWGDLISFRYINISFH